MVNTFFKNSMRSKRLISFCSPVSTSLSSNSALIISFANSIGMPSELANEIAWNSSIELNVRFGKLTIFSKNSSLSLCRLSSFSAKTTNLANAIGNNPQETFLTLWKMTLWIINFFLRNIIYVCTLWIAFRSILKTISE